MDKNWTNKLIFKMSFFIDDKTNITKTMIKHKMFPGNSCVSMIVMKKCYGGCGVAHTLQVHTTVYERVTNQILDEFDMGQGQFTKFMENIHSPQLSTSIN